MTKTSLNNVSLSQAPMAHVTYNELVSWYGHKAAYDLLLSLEKAASLLTNVIPFDRQERLQRAFDALDQELLSEGTLCNG